MNVLLVSTYELGRPSFSLAEAAARLGGAGATVDCLDLAVEELDEEAVRRAGLIAFHLPMHTATRLALAALGRVRSLNRSAHLCFFGLYAPPNEEHLRARGAGTVLGGESEDGLVSLLERLRAGGGPQTEPLISLARQRFVPPARDRMPALERYARLILPDGEERVAGYTEASRGCRHRCRHCPVVPVYGGRFRIVDREVVLEDVRRQVAAGARHITFGDADFLNGPGHVLPLVEAMHAEHPELTYDATIKVEHLLRHADLLPRLRASGCLFVTTAVESADDRVLALLDKRHTRADFEEAARRCDALGLDLAPTFVPFTPWTSRDDYVDLLRWLVRLDLVDRVAPVQLSIRLLIPSGSRLLELAGVRELTGPLDAEMLAHPWEHPDPGMDELADEVRELVDRMEARRADRRDIFAAIWRLAHRRAGAANPAPPDLRRPRPAPARMSEAWYCCAEPTRRQLACL